MKENGKVYLVGAGPGDPGLITVRGLSLLSGCDVVVYDRLANDTLLLKCKPLCEKIFAGKEAGFHSMKQGEINQLLIDKATEGKTVVRLKGGDPFIFGRGSEEAITLAEAGIEFEIIPGITAATGASAYSGIPLTHRNIATKCIFLTAHETPDKDDSQIEWDKLAKLNNTTFAIYMGASMVPAITDILIRHGKDGKTPAAIIENGTLPSQRILTSTLSEIPLEMKEHNFGPPLIFIIGENVGYNEILGWYKKKPLVGKRIVATRAEDQAYSLIELLTAEGAEVIPFKLIKTEINLMTEYLELLEYKLRYDWIFFTSENGVRYFFKYLNMLNKDARILSNCKIAVIGSGTEQMLKSFGLVPDFIPSSFTTETLIKEFRGLYNCSNLSFLRVRGDFGKDMLLDELEKLCYDVDSMIVYKIHSDEPDSKIKSDLEKKGADAFMFTSSSTVHNFFKIYENETAMKLLNSSAAIAIGPVTARTLEDYGVESIHVSDEHTINGMVNTLKIILK